MTKGKKKKKNRNKTTAKNTTILTTTEKEEAKQLKHHQDHHNAIDDNNYPSYPWNFVNQAGPGCHIARPNCPSSAWVLEWEAVDPDDYDDVVPDIAVDPDEQELVLCNLRPRESIVAYITVYDRVLRGRDRNVLTAGMTTSDDSGQTTQSCTTLIVLCPPLTFCHLCAMEFPPGTELDELPLESDVQVWNQHPNPQDHCDRAVGFPLQGGPFLCTQGGGGQLTHFFSGNLHAIDFRCPVGTPILAVADGTVTEAKDDNTLTGIAVSNLFQWNTIMIEVETRPQSEDDNDEASPLFVEYVHIRKALVKAGDRVTKGQIIGESGSVGFSPEPHLHFAAYLSKEPTAPTARVRFEASSENGALFLPQAGQYYDASGPQVVEVSREKIV